MKDEFLATTICSELCRKVSNVPANKLVQQLRTSSLQHTKTIQLLTHAFVMLSAFLLCCSQAHYFCYEWQIVASVSFQIRKNHSLKLDVKKLMFEP